MLPHRRAMMLATVLNPNLPYFQQIKPYYDIGLWPLWDAVGAVTAEDIINGYSATPTAVTFGQAGIGDGRTAGLFGYPASLLNCGSAGVQGKVSPNAGMASLWLKMDSADKWTDANAYTFFEARADATNRIYARKNGDMSIVLAYYATTLKQVVLPGLTTTRWLRLIFTWDKPGDEICLHANGILQKPPTTGLGNFGGSLASGYPNFASLPGTAAYCGLSTAIPSDADIYKYSRSTGQIVFEGDSRTNKTWPFSAADAAFPAGVQAYGGKAVASWAVSGSTTQAMINRAATGVDTLLKTGVKSTLVVWCGVNDGAGLTAQQIYDNLKSYCQARRTAGWDKIMLCTEIDSQANMTWHNTVWPALNVLIAADHSFADAVADLGADARLQNALDTTYYLSDKIHLTDAGYAVVAGIVAPVLASVA